MLIVIAQCCAEKSDDMDMSIDSYLNNLSGIYQSETTSSTKLKNEITSTDYYGATDEELMEVCREFEAYFLEQVFKGMQNMIPKSEEDSSTSKLTEYFKENTIRQIASDTTKTQSVGLAQTLYESMKRQYSVTDRV